MTKASTRTGGYPIQRRAGEIERLRIQREAVAVDAGVMLDRIGVGSRWRCLDLACGTGGITNLLSARVGSAGRVVGLDFDPVFIEHARSGAAANTEFMTGDAYRTGLPDRSFDLVHIRFLACTAGQPEKLIAEARRLTCEGCFVAMQEADFSTLRCYPPHPAWDRLRAALAASFPGADDDFPVAHRLFGLMRAAAFRDVQYRPFLIGVRSGDPWSDYLPATVESVRATVLEGGRFTADELESTLADCRAHLARPGTVFASFTVVQVWGRAP